jgi:hypothetical protein
MLKPIRRRLGKGCHAGALALLVILAICLSPQRAPAQEGDLSHTPQIWLQGITDSSFKHDQCRYDFQAFRKTTLDLLYKEPFTFLDLPGVTSLVDVPWLRVSMTIWDKSTECTVSVDYMICDKKIVTSAISDGTETHCPGTQRYFSTVMGWVAPDRVQAELTKMTTDMSQDLAAKWREANPR